MWFKEVLNNKTNIILIVIIILIGLLYYLNNSKNTNNTHEKFEIGSKINNKNNKPEFKVFYTNWCGWSKRILATLDSEEFKNKFNEVKNDVDVILVNCETTGKEECNARSVKGYPTMMLVKDNNVIEFNGNRTPDGIIDFIKNNKNM
jgi:thiol-disulfide isomerase/thioredoxin